MDLRRAVLLAVFVATSALAVQGPPVYVSLPTHPVQGGACVGDRVYIENTTGTMWCCVTSQWNACGSAGGTPAGSDTQIQFNDGGAFGGDAGLLYDKVTSTFTTTNLSLTGAPGTWLDGDDISWKIHGNSQGVRIFGTGQSSVLHLYEYPEGDTTPATPNDYVNLMRGYLHDENGGELEAGMVYGLWRGPNDQALGMALKAPGQLTAHLETTANAVRILDYNSDPPESAYPSPPLSWVGQYWDGGAYVLRSANIRHTLETPTPNSAFVFDFDGVEALRVTDQGALEPVSPLALSYLTDDNTNVGYCLLSGGAGGDPTWGACGGGTPGGSNTELQYNNAGSFGGTTGVTYDGAQGLDVTGQLATHSDGYYRGTSYGYFGNMVEWLTSPISGPILSITNSSTAWSQLGAQGNAGWLRLTGNSDTTQLIFDSNGLFTFAGTAPPTTLTSPSYTSSATTGNNAFAVSTNGARIDVGAGANDFLYSDGATVNAVGGFNVYEDASYTIGENYAYTGVNVNGSWTGVVYSGGANTDTQVDLMAQNGSATLSMYHGNSGVSFDDNGTFAFLGAAPPTTLTAPRYTSSAAASSNAFAVSTTGARIDFGPGSFDYAASDGTNVWFADDVGAVSGPDYAKLRISSDRGGMEVGAGIAGTAYAGVETWAGDTAGQRSRLYLVDGTSSVTLRSNGSVSFGAGTTTLSVPALDLTTTPLALADITDDGSANRCLLSGGAGGDPAWGSCPAGAAPNLNDLGNPTADKTFNMTTRTLAFSYSSPTGADGAFEIEGTAGFSGDLLHLHQHTGNPGSGTDLLHAEWADTDVTGLRLTGPSSTATAMVATGTVSVTGAVSATSFSGPLTGNASTATALAADPTACTAGQYVTDIAANGTLTCSTPSGAIACVAQEVWKPAAEVVGASTPTFSTAPCIGTTNIGSAGNRGSPKLFNMDVYTHCKPWIRGGNTGTQSGTVTVTMWDYNAGAQAGSGSITFSNVACADRAYTTQDLSALTGYVALGVRVYSSTTTDDPQFVPVSIICCNASF